MKKAKARLSNKVQNPVPGNPEFDRKIKEQVLVAVDKKVIRGKLYDESSFRTYAGHWKHRDEPLEPKKTEYEKIDKKQFDKDMKAWKQRSQQASARERLKKNGKVPTKSGKKLFEDFIGDMREATGLNSKQNVDHADMGNVCNTAPLLDYSNWILIVNDE